MHTSYQVFIWRTLTNQLLSFIIRVSFLRKMVHLAATMILVTVKIHVQKAMNRSKQVYLPYGLSTLGKALHAPSLGIRLSVLVLEWCIGRFLSLCY